MKSVHSIMTTAVMLFLAVNAKPVILSANNDTTDSLKMYGHNSLLQRRNAPLCNPTTNGWSPILNPTDLIFGLNWLSTQKDSVCSLAPMPRGGPDPCQGKGLTCFNGAKILVCNQTPNFVTVRCSTVVDYVNTIATQCMIKGKGFFGQMFDEAGWYVYVTEDNKECPKHSW